MQCLPRELRRAPPHRSTAADSGRVASQCDFCVPPNRAVAWALYTTLGRRWTSESGSGGVAILMIACAALLLPLELVAGEAPAWDRAALAQLAARTVCAALAQLGWDLAMRRGDLVLVASASYATPVLSTLFTCALFGQRVSGALVGGACLVAAGAVLCRWSVVRRPPPADEAAGR